LSVDSRPPSFPVVPRRPTFQGVSYEARSPKQLSEEELKAIESAVLDLRRTIAAADFFEAERILRRPALDASTLSRVVSEVRRLRALVKDAAPYFDRMETAAGGRGGERKIRQLQARLKAEIERA